MKRPVFSVIMTTHERPLLLERAIKSVISQDFADLEIIVITDGKERATFEVCALNLRSADSFIARSGPLGPARSRNIGLETARGDFCVFLDDDDTLAPGILSTAGALVDSGSGVYVWNFQNINEERGNSLPTFLAVSDEQKICDRNKADLMIANFIPNNCYAISTIIAQSVLFDESLRSAEDWDFLLGVFLSGCTFFSIDAIGSFVHRDNSGRTQRNPSSNEHWGPDIFYVYRKHPALTEQQRAARRKLLVSLGFDAQERWL